MLQTKGTLKSWKEDKGFGFIKPEGGGKDVFVHIRDFGNISRSPRVGDIVRYQSIQDGTGKYRAGDVLIEGVPRRQPAVRHKPAPGRPTSNHRPRNSRGFRRVVLPLVAIGVLGSGFLWTRMTPEDNRVQKSETASVRTASPEFRCEGKRRCSEMRSCEEATFYQRNCPNTEMDGDADGIPCEQQWCSTW